jgi:hypothetical protein
MRRCKFLVPTFAKGADEPKLEQREGYRVQLELGLETGDMRPFVLQCEPGDTRPRILADFASGYRLTDLGPLMLERYVRHPAAYREVIRDWRREAQRWLDAACERKGTREVRRMLDSVPAINTAFVEAHK